MCGLLPRHRNPKAFVGVDVVVVLNVLALKKMAEVQAKLRQTGKLEADDADKLLQLEQMQQQSGGARSDYEIKRYLDESVIDELEREGFFKKFTVKEVRK